LSKRDRALPIVCLIALLTGFFVPVTFSPTAAPKQEVCFMTAANELSFIVRRKETAKLLGIDVSTLHKWQKECPDFPKPVSPLGGRGMGFVRDEIKQWVKNAPRVSAVANEGDAS
jgi:predicted DNA-binding transcriptional regulator AlpA